MSHPEITELLREAASIVEAPNFVSEAKRRAQRARRRRRAATLGLCFAAAAAVVVIAVDLPPFDTPRATDTSPDPTPTASTTPQTSTEVTALPLTASLAQPPWTNAKLSELGWVDVGLPRLITADGAGLPTLAEDPVPRAVAAVEAQGTNGTGILILGDDGNWRNLDLNLVRASDASGYTSPALWQDSLSPDGTRLAIPQPQQLVVVTFSSATSTRYDVPGFNKSVVWSPDDQQVLVTTEERTGGSMVNIADGSVERVPFGATAGFAPNGSVVEVTGDSLGAELNKYTPGSTQPETISGVANINGPLLGEAPAVNSTVLAGITEVGGYSVPRGPQEWGGVVVTDLATGNPLALLPMHDYAYIYQSAALCWINNDTVLVSIPALSPTEPSHLVSWDYVTGDLNRVSQLPTSAVVSIADNLIG